MTATQHTRGSYRKLEPGMEAKLVALCEAVYRIKTTPEYWTWKYFGQLPDERHSAFVGEYDDRIVAMAGVMPFRLKSGADEIHAGQLVDIMKDPTCPAVNVVIPVMRESVHLGRTWFGMMFGFTNENSYKIHARLFKHTIGFRPQRLVRPVVLRALVSGGRGPVASTVRFLLRLADGVYCGLDALLGPRRDATIRCHEVGELDARFDALWQKACVPLNVATVRNQAYLTWRYVRHPLWRYRIIVAEKGCDLLGFIVVRTVEGEGRKKGLIVDMLTDPEQNGPAARSLLAAALNVFRQEGVGTASGWMLRHTPYYRVFRRFGFVAVSSRMLMMTESYNPAVPTATYATAANWYMTMGDCDAF